MARNDTTAEKVAPRPKKRGPGRPVGAKSRTTLLKEKALLRILNGKRAPLDFLLALMESDDAPLAHRIDAAKAAAPYVHKRQPIAIENSDKGPFRIFDSAKLAGMSETEIRALMVLIEKAGAAEGDEPK